MLSCVFFKTSAAAQGGRGDAKLSFGMGVVSPSELRGERCFDVYVTV